MWNLYRNPRSVCVCVGVGVRACYATLYTVSLRLTNIMGIEMPFVSPKSIPVGISPVFSSLAYIKISYIKPNMYGLLT